MLLLKQLLGDIGFLLTLILQRLLIGVQLNNLHSGVSSRNLHNKQQFDKLLNGP
jgi:hypothetical protein